MMREAERTAIRKMISSDIPAVMDLIRQLSADMDEEFPVERDRFEDHFRGMQEAGDVYYNVVACDEEKVIGFCSLLLYRSFFHIKGTAQINELEYVLLGTEFQCS